MTGRSKRTYRLPERTLARVRELTARYSVAQSQDAVVELAVDRLYREVLEDDESRRWEAAAADAEFRAEAESIARDLASAEQWPA